MGKYTQCVHTGTISDRVMRGVNSPLYASSSFEYMDVSDSMYPRYNNTPNQKAVAKKLSALENTESSLLFSSGMAAISTVIFSLAGQGDHVIMQRDIYGGTHHFVTAEFERFGIEFTFVSNQAKDIEAAIKKNTRLIYIETPSNPLLVITDIEAVSKLAQSKNIPTAIDNTFASPMNQNPHDFGIDIIIHSGTKYLGGHSDLCCGAVLATEEMIDKIRASAANFGGSMNAATCHLLERSLKTLGIRVEKQNRNAQILAEYLADHLYVEKVYYPGLTFHPGFDIAAKQMRGFGGVLSFELNDTKIQPDHFVRKLSLITPALSLGGVESIICSHAVTSHAKISAKERKELGIADGLFRLSVGIEDVADLIGDLKRALE